MDATFGTLSNEKIIEELNEVLQTDIDALGAYREAVSACEELEVREQLLRFQRDHERHISELGDCVRRCGGKPVQSVDLKGYIQRGFTKVAGLIGTEACLRAMLNNEKLTNSVYARHCQKGFPSDILDVLRRGLSDEQRHFAWIDSALRQRIWEQTSPVPIT